MVIERNNMTIIRELLTIISQAKKRKIAMYNISNLSEKLSEHIVKLLIWKDMTQDANKWTTEIVNWLQQVHRMKLKSGSFSRKDYKELLFDSHFETFEECIEYIELIVDDLQSQGYPVPPYYNWTKLWEKLQQYIQDCCRLLTYPDTTRDNFKNYTNRLTY